jgi:methylenetetrahydrofolate reductase (NADPH)
VTLLATMSCEEQKRHVIDFMRRASTEISTHDEKFLPTLANKLPPGTTVYIAHTPTASLEDVVRVATRIEALGLRASPHIVARRLKSERALKDALGDLREAGVEQIMLVAGDQRLPSGKFSSALEVLETGALSAAEFKRVGVCGHPQGHRAIGPTTLWKALYDKQAMEKQLDVQLHIVTQFGFDPEAVCAWDRHLTEHDISLPVHVGIAGPAPLPQLIKFAMQCGVATSLHALMKNMSATSQLPRLATSPDEMVLGLIRGREAHANTQIVQPHFYSFGGAMATARWLRAVRDGRFDVTADAGRIRVNA